MATAWPHQTCRDALLAPGEYDGIFIGLVPLVGKSMTVNLSLALKLARVNPAAGREETAGLGRRATSQLPAVTLFLRRE
ncbi:MAG TPA: hypothetical protein VLZ30_03685 [Verrucomicrobiae bacterium]|nr:hypothetical protein [Verrucomicrobiae bacterium]